MTKQILWTGLLAGLATAAQAHFLFVIPEANGRVVQVVLSEELRPSAEVDAGLIGGTKLWWRHGEEHGGPLRLEKTQHAYSAALPHAGTQIVYGLDDVGVMQLGQAKKPFLLLYHPKTIVGDPSSAEPVGEETPIEIVPAGGAGALRLKLLVHGQPQGGSEITAILPDGSRKKLKPDETELSEVLTQAGRYGAWARYWETGNGERDGKQYEGVHHYATLVFDTQAPITSANSTNAGNATATRFATLPQAASSFGEVVSDGWLYVYGGHVARTHVYSTASVSGRFERLNLSDGKTWETLPEGPALQGMNLAAYKGKIYRIGGMQPRNKPGEKQAIFSVEDCARFDPETRTWETLPSLPEPRSSHDVVVLGDKLIVVGGWTLQGSAGEKWLDTLAVMDLGSSKLEWNSVPQPFKRRALMAAALGGQMYVLGGMDEKGKIAHDVNIYNPGTRNWTDGPALPGGETNGFAPAACTHHDVLYVSVADGSLYRLESGRGQWEKLGSATPRIAHRIGFWDEKILISGGAEKGNNSDLIESVAAAAKPLQ